MMSPYRKYVAEAVVKHCRSIGVALLASGTGIHAVPISRIKQYPGLVRLIAKYRDEIMQYLSSLVE